MTTGPQPPSFRAPTITSIPASLIRFEQHSIERHARALGNQAALHRRPGRTQRRAIANVERDRAGLGFVGQEARLRFQHQRKTDFFRDLQGLVQRLHEAARRHLRDPDARATTSHDIQARCPIRAA